MVQQHARSRGDFLCPSPPRALPLGMPGTPSGSPAAVRHCQPSFESPQARKPLGSTRATGECRMTHPILPSNPHPPLHLPELHLPELHLPTCHLCQVVPPGSAYEKCRDVQNPPHQDWSVKDMVPAHNSPWWGACSQPLVGGVFTTPWAVCTGGGRVHNPLGSV